MNTTKDELKEIIQYTKLSDLEEKLLITLADYKSTKEQFYKRLQTVIDEVETNYYSEEINELNNEIQFRGEVDPDGDYLLNLKSQKAKYEAKQIEAPYKIGYARYSQRAFNELKSIIEKFNKPETKETVFVTYQHSQIFVGNAFEVWQKMFEHFNITFQSSADVNFMFSAMKYKELIHKNIEGSDLREWINETYLFEYLHQIKETKIYDALDKNKRYIFEAILDNTKT